MRGSGKSPLVTALGIEAEFNSNDFEEVVSLLQINIQKPPDFGEVACYIQIVRKKLYSLR